MKPQDSEVKAVSFTTANEVKACSFVLLGYILDIFLSKEIKK